uniref:Acetyl-coenzyme A carboxylase carboxyl transferase subunit beta, chloroplastic n=1 Tax=Syzygium malaccense TaxID=219892 RepID=A0A7G9XKL2_9MYRT|nr:acetyl-CoA carboxylase beta subunit [Syzygium malaccense]YP_010992199.1 acetyl-CoA carboxylase beta subunit [Syzygium garcinioides]YP_010992369.1 acetyl-CoA carboxylase beta subunit [Syzygium pachycladum]YP_010993049.1 acetyl-CoA carboxylase carboxyltransferase beta subunit [Syzygium versteegii]QNO35920.1 acetyl-CoA carboxylase beta subunit [Syzygium malaccense]WOZ08301.1 acetyl-CoA carboxylase beta subunit [Syzygium garcinioides]WOZ08471.1 acetyl-CoA carboxylase beta subunit [Syzygium pac
MEKRWFNSMLYKGKLEYRCGLSKLIDRFGNPIEKTSVSEGPVRNDMDKKIHSWSESSSYSNANHLVGVRDVRNFISDDTFLVRDSNRNIYSIYSWNNHITRCINSYLGSQICIESSFLSSSDNSSDSYIYSSIYGESRNSNERGSSSIRTSRNGIDFTRRENSTDFDLTQKYRHLWVQCENCYGLNYKKLLKSKMNICDQCGYHLKMSSSDRIELSIDPGTWDPMDEDMVSLDPIEFHSEEEPYKDRIDSYQRKTGLTDAVQTGTGRLNGIPIAIGVMDFQFMGGSMGSVVGEKITRLIEYATNKFLPLILVCASGGARMQEGSLSLMQMAKISAALYDYQSHKKLFYVSILTSPTTGGVTASFGMLGDIIIAEPNAYIAFAGKRVIEQTLNKIVPEGSQAAEYLFDKGLFDPIVPRNPLKGVLSELFKLHAFFPLN